MVSAGAPLLVADGTATGVPGERTGSSRTGYAADAGGVGRWATWTLMLMVLALIGIAVGDELAIAHPGDEATLGFTILAFGGPALFCSPRSSSCAMCSAKSRAHGCRELLRS